MKQNQIRKRGLRSMAFRQVQRLLKIVSFSSSSVKSSAKSSVVSTSAKEQDRAEKPQRRRRRRPKRREKAAAIDAEFNGVLVESAVEISNTAEEDSDTDWSVGWFETFSNGKMSNDSDNSFAVLVPCYSRSSFPFSTMLDDAEQDNGKQALKETMEQDKENQDWNEIADLGFLSSRKKSRDQQEFVQRWLKQQ